MPTLRSTPDVLSAILKATEDGGRRRAIAVLTTPDKDRAGDIVRPDGGDWSRFAANPVVDWHHLIPIGRGSVELKAVERDNHSFLAPVGTTTFFQRESDCAGLKLLGRSDLRSPEQNKVYSPAECVDAAQQAWRLVRDGIATGVSIEFDRIPGCDREIGHSLLEQRPARDYTRWSGRRYAITADPVNDAAGILSDGVIGKAMGLAQSGRFPDGEKVIGPILKALRLAYPAARPTFVPGYTPSPVRLKAMDYNADDSAPALADDPAADPEVPPDEAAASDLPPEATVAHDCGQMCTDLADQCDGLAKKSLHPKSRKFFAKLAEELRGVAEDCVAHGDAVSDEVSGNEAPEEEPAAEPDGDEDSPVEKAVKVPPPLKRDPAGRVVTKAGYRPWRLSDIKAAPVAKADPDEDADLSALSLELDAVRREKKRLARDAKYMIRAARVNGMT